MNDVRGLSCESVATTHMLLYRKACLGLPLLLRYFGSALPRALFPATFSTILAVLFEFLLPHALLESFFDHPYPFQVFAYIVSFALVFRTNIAYQRYWEMRSSVVNMSSKWGDAVALALAFEENSWAKAMAATATAEKSRRSRTTTSLPAVPLPAPVELTAQPSDGQLASSLASDDGLSSIIETPEALAARRSQAHLVHRMSLVHALALQYLRRDNSLSNLSDPTDSDDGRGGRAPADGLLTELFGDHDDPQRHERFIDANPLPVLGGVSKAEASALRAADDRVAFVYGLLLTDVQQRRGLGGLESEAPVFSRVHQMFSDGYLGYTQAKKTEDTPFPFPYAQILAFMLYIFAVLFPLLTASKVGGEGLHSHDFDGPAWLKGLSQSAAPVLTFFTVLSYFGLHEVARTLEDPFTHPPNDLPAVTMQEEFNTRLLDSWDACGAVLAAELEPESLNDLMHAHAERRRLAALTHQDAQLPEMLRSTNSAWERACRRLHLASRPNRFWESSTPSGNSRLSRAGSLTEKSKRRFRSIVPSSAESSPGRSLREHSEPIGTGGALSRSESIESSSREPVPCRSHSLELT